MGEEPPAVGGSEAVRVAWKYIRGISFRLMNVGVVCGLKAHEEDREMYLKLEIL